MKNQPSRSSQPESLEQRLSTHPELRAKIEGLLSVVENAQGDIVKASEAEQRVFEEIRQLSQVALPGFLTSKSGTGPLNCKKDNNHKASSRLNL
jgi:DNA-binding NtrC family response regulator